MIHSVDSVDLAAEIDRRAGSHGLVKDILLEINIGGEESKGGIAPSELFETAKAVSGLENVRIRGLMTIPPVNCDEKYFASMQELLKIQSRNILSCPAWIRCQWVCRAIMQQP